MPIPGARLRDMFDEEITTPSNPGKRAYGDLDHVAFILIYALRKQGLPVKRGKRQELGGYRDGRSWRLHGGGPSAVPIEAKRLMATPGSREVSVLLTEEHLQKLIEDHLLKENETDDRVKIARIVQKFVDAGLG